MRKGVALLTVLFLTLIALIFSAVAIYISITSTTISGGEKRYKSTLEYAKGISYYLTDEILSGNINSLVPNYTNCINNQCNLSVNLPKTIFSNSNYEVNTTLLGIVEVEDGEIYTFRIEVKNRKVPSEKVIVEFGYKVY
ncbi:MAG: hypothetical protein DSZ26_00695 [Thermovibrio sp.]|nr:MAG: hypothetical protein DSZ26_00695 [Thermovibrio sp.]